MHSTHHKAKRPASDLESPEGTASNLRRKTPKAVPLERERRGVAFFKSSLWALRLRLALRLARLRRPPLLGAFRSLEDEKRTAETLSWLSASLLLSDLSTPPSVCVLSLLQPAAGSRLCNPSHGTPEKALWQVWEACRQRQEQRRPRIKRSRTTQTASGGRRALRPPALHQPDTGSRLNAASENKQSRNQQETPKKPHKRLRAEARTTQGHIQHFARFSKRTNHAPMVVHGTKQPS